MKSFLLFRSFDETPVDGDFLSEDFRIVQLFQCRLRFFERFVFHQGVTLNHRINLG